MDLWITGDDFDYSRDEEEEQQENATIITRNTDFIFLT